MMLLGDLLASGIEALRILLEPPAQSGLLADGPDHGMKLDNPVRVLPPGSPACGLVDIRAESSPAAALTRKLPGDRSFSNLRLGRLAGALANADRSQVSDLAIRAETFHSLSTPAPPIACSADAAAGTGRCAAWPSMRRCGRGSGQVAGRERPRRAEPALDTGGSSLRRQTGGRYLLPGRRPSRGIQTGPDTSGRCLTLDASGRMD